MDTANPDQRWTTQALAFSLGRIGQNLSIVSGFPELTRGDAWACIDDGGWIGGHWVGLLWLAHACTGDRAFEAQARKWAARLSPRQYDTTTHDLGFLFELSHVLGANLTGDDSLKAPAIQAARTLSKRFNPRGSLFHAWGPLNAPAELRGRTIIDTMMNLDLLFWGSQETGESRFAEQAAAHARTCLKNHVRPDFSTSHGAEFDPDTGAFLEQKTHQGYSAGSCWSRGQSWGVYGFSDCFRATGDLTFLSTARELADYALEHLPRDLVPFWDYASPDVPADVRDSSAASILSSALLYLAALEPDGDRACRWRTSAGMILQSLWDGYTSRESIEPSILIHGTRSKPEGSLDHGLIYGDYYFVEALVRLCFPDLAAILH